MCHKYFAIKVLSDFKTFGTFFIANLPKENLTVLLFVKILQIMWHVVMSNAFLSRSTKSRLRYVAEIQIVHRELSIERYARRLQFITGRETESGQVLSAL